MNFFTIDNMDLEEACFVKHNSAVCTTYHEIAKTKRATKTIQAGIFDFKKVFMPF